ncbi:hypothetical protein GCM10020331_006300 [Ectobacillus funiculus]
MKEMVPMIEYLNLQELIIEGNDQSQLNEVRNFLAKQGLRLDNNVEYTVALYNGDKIVATGSFEGRILKCIAVDDGYRGMGITNKNYFGFS